MKKNPFPHLKIYIRSDSDPDPYPWEFANEANKFLTQYHFDVWDENPKFPEAEFVGEGYFFQLHLRQGMQQGFSALQIFDYHSTSLNLGDTLFDLDENIFFPEIKPLLKDEKFIPNIFCAECFQLLAGYRGKGVGTKIFKEIYTRFGSTFDWTVVVAEPFQFHNPISFNYKGEELLPEWHQAMKWDTFEKEEKMAEERINKSIEALGFQQLKDSKYFLATPAFHKSLRRKTTTIL